VLEDPAGDLFVSKPGEIVPAESHGFYTYDAKYVDEAGAALKVPVELPDAVEAALKETAARAFRALGCDGMARADFFLMDDDRFVVNELNTIPGFTNISMYPKAMAASGIGYADLIDRLVAHGLARAGRIDWRAGRRMPGPTSTLGAQTCSTISAFRSLTCPVRGPFTKPCWHRSAMASSWR
jgi:D-alanine-D-alanine ligase